MLKDICKTQVIIATVLLVLSSAGAQAQSETIRTNEEIVSWAKEYMNNAVQFDHFSGSVLIARNGKPIFKQSYGLSN